MLGLSTRWCGVRRFRLLQSVFDDSIHDRKFNPKSIYAMFPLDKNTTGHSYIFFPNK